MRIQNSNSQGFSLIEIVIAVGIIGVAILPTVGILSVGVSQSGDSARNTVTTQILNQVNAEVRQSVFTNLTDSASEELFFDEEGIPLAVSNNKALWKATYSSRSATLPGSSTPISSLRVVSVITEFIAAGKNSMRTQTNFLYVSNKGSE